MIRAVIWKEVREQGLIGLTLVVLGSGVLAGAAALADPPSAAAPPSDVIRHLGAGLLATLMLAVTAGMVCGGAVFAAEREAGTMGFLESLPASRWRLWLAKFAAGFGLSAAQAGALVGVAALLGLVPTLGWARAVCVFSLLAFAWGVLGSTLARTTLGSVGVAIPASVLGAVAVLVPVMIFFSRPGGNVATPRPLGALLFLAGMFAIPLALSAWIFSAPDRHRRASGGSAVGVLPVAGAGAGRPPGARPQLGIGALAWMTARQMRLPALVLSAFAGVVGLSMLAPGLRPVLAWPGLALAAGVLAGVTAFADEQSRGSARFWGEQRLPVGRVWAVKVGFHLLLAAGLLLLLVLPMAVRAQFDQSPAVRGRSVLGVVFRSQLFDEIGRNGWKYLVVPAAYGFAAGHLCGLLFRKLAVACGVAGIVGGVGAALWMPSLLAGGVNHWQLWAPPLIVLLAARLLMSAWAADRVATRGPLRTLAAGGLAAALVLAAGIGYRVLEVPDSPGAEDDLAYVAALPPIDQNAAGRDFRTATERYARAATLAAPRPEGVLPMPPLSPTANSRGRPDDQFELVVRDGWGRVGPALADYLDRTFARSEPPGPAGLQPVPPMGTPAGDPVEEPWHVLAARAADQPPGLFDYPQTLKMTSFRETLQNARRMSLALLARGLREQAAGKLAAWVGEWTGFPLARALAGRPAGNPAVFVEDLRTVLALGRTMRNGSVIISFQAGAEVESLALVALDTWLDGLDHSAESVALLRRVGAMLEGQDPDAPFDPTPHYLTERFVLREAQKAPAQWLPVLLTPPGVGPEAVDSEVDLVGLAWAVPWERERTSRLVGLGFEAGPPPDYRLISGRPGTGLLIRPRMAGELADLDRNLRAYRRAAVLKVALRAYRAERGEYPAADRLQTLVELGYLSRLPRDPHDEARGFGYRAARPLVRNELGEPGENLQSVGRIPGTMPDGRKSVANARFVPAGQIILWSVGPDGADNGGTQAPTGAAFPVARAEDIVYLVPRGPAP